ncbi:hypothetical protein MMC28_010524 [Mycoblastus sanguinarius]|nr:hypothetical protein [Mycoblastus sanguinarius]
MTIQDQPNSLSNSTLSLPRLLCLHGGGTNARIFHCQTRALRAQLNPYFRLCFADAPFVCQSAGPDITTVYETFKPFRRWLRWLTVHPEIETKTAVKEVEAAIEAAITEDNAKGATGEWVGILGFSQGAKVAGSLLLRQQGRADRGERSRVRFKFAVLMAGSGPLVSLEPDSGVLPGLGDAAQIKGVTPWEGMNGEHILRLPTIHVHGIGDPGLELHRQLLEQYCEQGSARLVEWDGNHRVPIKKNDVAAVVEQILDVARETGVLSD